MEALCNECPKFHRRKSADLPVSELRVFQLPCEPGETNDHPFSLFGFELPTEYTLTISHNVTNNRFTARPADANPTSNRRMMNNLWEVLIFEKGQLYHLVFTWRDTEMAFCLDGELLGWRNQAMRFGGPLGNAVLTLGNTQGSHGAKITFTAFKLSDRFLKEEDVNNRAPTADIHTLLLDEFEVWPPNEDSKERSPRVQTTYLEKAASKRHAIIVTLDGNTRAFLVVDENGEVIDELVQQVP